MSARDEELRRLAVVATGLRNCNKAWRNPVSTVDCDLYYRDNSLALAEFYAAANPTVVLELLDEIERLRVVFEAAKRVLHTDKLPFYEDCAEFDGAMTLLERAVEDATKAEQGGE